MRWALAGLAAVTTVPAQSAAGQTEQAVVGYSVRTSARETGLSFRLANGREVSIVFREGTVLANGDRLGAYRRGGPLETQWRAFTAWAGSLSTDEAVVATRRWTPEGLPDDERATAEALRERLSGLVPAADVEPPVAPRADVTEAVIAASEAAAAASARVDALRDDIRTTVESGIRQAARASGRQNQNFEFQFDPREPRFTSPVEAIFNGMLALAGAFVALTAIAFGTSFFAGRQLDVVADAVSASLTRSFFVGLFAQPLLLPAFGAMIAGLALTVVGILVIPFAILAFLVTLVAALIGGYLAVARVAGSAFLKRRSGDHGVEQLGVLRSLAYGLAILLAIWLPAALLGWAPVVGPLLTWTAAVFTWALVTTGFGAALLTRGGVRTTFGRRFHPPELPPATLYETPGSEISTGEWLHGSQR